MTLYLIAILVLVFLVAATLWWISKSKTKDLEEKNKRLSALRKLDEVMMTSSLDLQEVAQKVTDAIAFELGFEIGVLALIDKERGVLKRVAMSNTSTGVQAKKVLPFPYEKLEIPLDFDQNLSIEAIKTGERRVTHDLYDLFMPVLDKNISKKIQDTVGVKTSLIYPVRARGKTIGAMIISVSCSEEELSQYEKESIEDLVDVVGIALDNAMLYQQLRETSQKLAQANERLKVLDKLKDDFVSIASHELRTPMTAVRSYAWMALHKSDIPLSQKLDRYLYRILLSTERLINLVSDMLNVSRIESGHIEINPKSFDMVALVKDIIEEIKPKAVEKRIQITILEHPFLHVFADPDKVREVVLNLLGNALKFTYPGGIVTVSFFVTEGEIETSIKDSGQGIAREYLGNLFKKFGRLDSSYVAISTSGGTGLGLYISKSLIELMHGRIWARSEGLEKGAEFSFSLPRATAEVLAHAEDFAIKAKGEAKTLEPVAI